MFSSTVCTKEPKNMGAGLSVGSLDLGLVVVPLNVTSYKRILTYVMKPVPKTSHIDTCGSDIFIPAKRFVRMHAWNFEPGPSNGPKSKKQHLRRLNVSSRALPAQKLLSNFRPRSKYGTNCHRNTLLLGTANITYAKPHIFHFLTFSLSQNS